MQFLFLLADEPPFTVMALGTGSLVLIAFTAAGVVIGGLLPLTFKAVLHACGRAASASHRSRLK